MKRLITLGIYSVIIVLLFTQCGGNKYYRAGKKFADSNNYSEAISNFNKSVDQKPEFSRAYLERAKAYEATGKIEEAAQDYEKLIVLEPKEEDYYYNAARLRLQLGEYDTAFAMANKAIKHDKKHLKAYYVKIDALVAQDKKPAALEAANNAIEIDKTKQGYLRRANIHYSIGNFELAEKDYRSAIDKDGDLLEAYVGLAKSLYELDKLNEALGVCMNALGKDDSYKPAYLTRAMIYHKKVDYPNAINDLSKVIVLYPEADDIYDIYLKRGELYYEFNQHMNAINDYSKVIKADPDNGMAYYKRARANESITKYDAAVKDYEKLLNLEWNHPEKLAIREEAKERLFELKREEEKPVIVLDNPTEKEELTVEIQKGVEVIELKGHIDDASEIKTLTVNGNRILVQDEKDRNFVANIILKDKEEFNVTATDVYGNTTDNTYKIRRTEVDPPRILLIAPYASDNNQIYLETDDDNLYIEGTIMDESKIKSISIGDINASYPPDKQNPTFTATVNILNKDRIKITVEDIYGNKTEETYIFNREAADIAATNPMGKTWAIFIENSNYKSFASLQGPGKDVTLMKSALAQYKVHNVIHKKDMTKKEMERFFSIELRDLVKSNRVNSVLIWYAGHGKYINETGYWVPVDAQRGDEFTYFNISALKAAMQSYSKYITHTLVITDACESGPTFYQAMRSTPKVRSCGNWEATKFKSSQVFSSAGYELASDNSQFTRTFSNSLMHNPDMCIPIEKIVLKVSSAVTKTGSQKPQFGKISGLEDENGTFFFMKK